MTNIPARIALLATVSTFCVLGAQAEPTIGAEGRNGYVNLPSAFAPDENEIRFSAYFTNQDTLGRRIDYQATEWLGIGKQLSDQIDPSGNIVDDASIDLRLNLLPEGTYWPAIALGIDDIVGDGARAGEYLVASKSLGDFDASLGLGWGKYSSEARIYDPLTVSTENLFTGEATPFVGIAYNTPLNGLSIAAEYSETASGDDYRYGLSYDGSFFHAGAYYQGEDQFTLGISLFADPHAPLAQQRQFGAPLTVVPRARLGLDPSPAWYQGAPVGRVVGEALIPVLEKEGFSIHAIKIDAQSVAIELDGSTHIQTPFIFGRISRVLAKTAPASVDRFTFITISGNGVPISEVTILRSDFEAQQDRPDRVAASYNSADIRGGKRLSGDNVYRKPAGFDFDYSPGLGFARIEDADEEKQIVLSPRVTASAKLGYGLSFNGRASTYLNAPDPYTDPADSVNRVRSDRLHYIDEAVVVDRLTVDYHAKLGRSLYGRVSAGYLETQYAGVNVEALFAPADSPFAVGISASDVRKRDPENQFALLDKSIQTHIATLYWDTGYKGTELSASYGKYLAGDMATSFGFEKKFNNGWAINADVTIGEDFSETDSRNDITTSLAFTIPMQWAIPTKRTRRFDLSLESDSTKDFGSALDIANPLYDDVDQYDQGDYKLRWGAFWQ